MTFPGQVGYFKNIKKDGRKIVFVKLLFLE